MSETKDYYFTDEQIDKLLRLVRSEALNLKVYRDDEHESYNELANIIEDQIVNHPTND